MLREDTFSVTCTVDGVDLGVFEAFEGGEADSEELVAKQGAMGPPISLGGSRSFENVTVKALQRPALYDNIHWLLECAGRKPMVVIKQPLDLDKNAFKRPMVYTGTLKRVSSPNTDASGSDEAFVELEMTVTSVN